MGFKSKNIKPENTLLIQTLTVTHTQSRVKINLLHNTELYGSLHTEQTAFICSMDNHRSVPYDVSKGSRKTFT